MPKRAERDERLFRHAGHSPAGALATSLSPVQARYSQPALGIVQRHRTRTHPIMKVMFFYGAAAVALLAGTTALAQATDAAQAPQRPMADEVLTRAELQTKVRSHFAKADANRDGVLTAGEIGKRGGRMHRRMAAMHGGDGTHADPSAMFDRVDANHDGSISREEFAAHHQVRIEKRVVSRGDMAADATAGRRMHRRHGMAGMMMLKKADSNKDGRVTLAEAEGAALHHFDTADANHDGQVTRDERRQMRQQMRAERRQNAG
jgi:Ca2+-binding EF-hand superfamily protein